MSAARPVRSTAADTMTAASPRPPATSRSTSLDSKVCPSSRPSSNGIAAGKAAWRKPSSRCIWRAIFVLWPGKDQLDRIKVVGCRLIDEIVPSVLIEQVGMAAPGDTRRLRLVLSSEFLGDIVTYSAGLVRKSAYRSRYVQPISSATVPVCMP